MVMDDSPATPGDTADATEALAQRLRHDMVCALELFTVYLGERLGLYRALATDGPATSAELAARTGTDERYVREWLEHHAASGLVEVGPAADPLARRYRLPSAHVPVLADSDDVRYRAYNGVEIARAGRGLPQLVEAFRTGGAPPGLPWAPEGRADYNRSVFLNLLGTRWLPAIADVDRRLRGEPPARVADLACGTGWSSIAMARGMLRPSGSVIIADELVEDEFTAPASELERYHYGWSVLACLPGAMSDPSTAATGAVMRPATLRRYAREAGFADVEVLPLTTDTWRFYRLTR